MTLAFSPRSKSVGHTRLPTFSTMIRSRRSRSSTSMARLIMLDSRWHAPPVLICTAAMPCALIFSASTLLAMSPSMTAMLNSSRSASIVARMVDVLPEPGLASRSSTNTWLSAKRLRSCAASWSFLSRMGCFISICMLNPPIDQAAVSVMNRIGKARRMHVAFRLRPMGKRLPRARPRLSRHSDALTLISRRAGRPRWNRSAVHDRLKASCYSRRTRGTPYGNGRARTRRRSPSKGFGASPC